MTFVMHAIVWLVMIGRVDASASDTLAWGVRFWLVSLPITGAWCAISTLIGSFFRTPMVGLLLTCAVFFVMFFVGFALANAYSGIDASKAAQALDATKTAYEDTRTIVFMRFLYPNSLDTWLLSGDVQRVMVGVGVSALYALSTCVSGSLAFARRDV
jgi:hypothetical protein